MRHGPTLLIWGQAEGCVSVHKNFAIKETSVDPSLGAGKDASACIVKPSAASLKAFVQPAAAGNQLFAAREKPKQLLGASTLAENVMDKAENQLFAARESKQLLGAASTLAENVVHKAENVVHKAENVLRSVFGSDQCPSSPSTPHASCQVAVTVSASCSDVVAEMTARAKGSQDGSWVDPHNGGKYSAPVVNPLTGTGYSVSLQRVTGGHKPGPYTDKIMFTLTSQDHVHPDAASCTIQGCSASQSTSVYDYSTNYCNQRNLYCGKADGCTPVLHDWNIQETSVKPSFGAGKDAKACIVSGVQDM